MKQVAWDKIHSATKQTSISLAHMGIEDNEIQAVMLEIKKRLPNISVLDLDNNNLSDKGAHILAKHLPNFKNLTALGLQFNKLDKEGVKSLLTNKPSHLEIFFHGNKIPNVSEMARIENEIDDTKAPL